MINNLVNVKGKHEDQKAVVDARIKLYKKLKKYAPYLMFLEELIDSRIKKEKIKRMKAEERDYPKLGIDAWKKITDTNTFRFGTDLMGQPIYSDQITQHVLVLGSTGSGKSVFLLQLLKQVLGKGGGATFIDGKADLKLMRQVMAIAYEEGRHDDIMVLNFNAEKTEENKQVRSNTFNILTSGEPDEIFETLKSVALPNKSGDFFVGQATGVLRAALVGLFFDRDVMGKAISMKDLSDRLALNAFRVQMIPPEDPSLPIEKQRPHPAALGNNPSLLPYAHLWCPPTYEFNGMLAKDYYFNYLSTYGGHIIADDLDEEPEIPDQMTVQHGYSQNYFGFLNELSTKFANIFNAKYADIDFKEIISDNKILYVLLPEMKLSPATAQKLGLLVIDAMKKGISKSLGADAEANMESGFLDTLRTKSNPTHLFILDEFGSYITEAIEAILAQARSVGIGVIVAVQDIASLNKGESKEILKERIVANTVTKVFLKVTDNVSARQVVELAGKEKIISNTSYELDDKKELKATDNLQEQEVDFTDVKELATFKSGFGITIINGQPRKFVSTFYEPEPINIKFNKLAP